MGHAITSGDLRNVAGFRVALENVCPKYDLGELIWHSDTDTARIGELVIAKLAGDSEGKNAGYSLGRLVNLNDSEVQLSQPSPERTNVIGHSRV